MTNEELVTAIQSGDADKLPLLWEQVEGLVRWKARRVMNAMDTAGIDHHGLELEDFVNTGYLALDNAIKTYKSDGGLFSGWLGYYLQSEFGELTRRRTPAQCKEPLHRSLSLNEKVGDDDSLTFLDSLEDPSNSASIVEHKVWLEQLHGALETAMIALSPQQQTILHMLFYDGKTQGEIADELSTTHQSISRSYRLAVQRMRERDILELLAPFAEKSAADIKALMEKTIDEGTDFYLGLSAKAQKSPVEALVIDREKRRKDYITHLLGTI